MTGSGLTAGRTAVFVFSPVPYPPQPTGPYRLFLFFFPKSNNHQFPNSPTHLGVQQFSSILTLSPQS